MGLPLKSLQGFGVPTESYGFANKQLAWETIAPLLGIAAAVGPRRRPRVPLRALGRRLDDGDVARRLQIAQPERDRVGADRGGDLVNKGFAGKLDLRTDWVAQMRGAQWRGPLPSNPRSGVLITAFDDGLARISHTGASFR